MEFHLFLPVVKCFSCLKSSTYFNNNKLFLHSKDSILEHVQKYWRTRYQQKQCCASLLKKMFFSLMEGNDRQCFNSGSPGRKYILQYLFKKMSILIKKKCLSDQLKWFMVQPYHNLVLYKILSYKKPWSIKEQIFFKFFHNVGGKRLIWSGDPCVLQQCLGFDEGLKNKHKAWFIWDGHAIRSSIWDT